ncbi:MAG TPA: lysoplasmalogenase [Herpetosiphonaceae bacterium]
MFNGVTIVLTLLALASAALHIRAEYGGSRAQVYLFKPLTTVAILLIAAGSSGETLPAYRYAIIAGLLCSLAGDVFLMLPADRFLAGLVSFLLAHLCYIVAFNVGVQPLMPLWSGLPFLAYGMMLFARLRPHLGSMALPVAGYSLVISVMAWQACARWLQLATPDALLAGIGAVLFVASDSLLAIDRFAGSFRWAHLAILVTYYVAQWLIAASTCAL